jgi:TonB family protein
MRMSLLLVALAAACGGAQEGPSMRANPDGSVTVPIRILERQRLSGERDPRLPTDVEQDFVSAAVTDPRVQVELCLDAEGNPARADVLASSNHERADELALETVRGWRFSPTLVGGKPMRVCTVVTFRWRVSFPMKRDPTPLPSR